ncbi:hypothetical protein RJ55_06763 [Drechmeria coniospora]|nr:hypothetical protein RJ55_06763 [Drechmeria coniospora]
MDRDPDGGEQQMAAATASHKQQSNRLPWTPKRRLPLDNTSWPKRSMPASIVRITRAVDVVFRHPNKARRGMLPTRLRTKHPHDLMHRKFRPKPKTLVKLHVRWPKRLDRRPSDAPASVRPCAAASPDSRGLSPALPCEAVCPRPRPINELHYPLVMLGSASKEPIA